MNDKLATAVFAQRAERMAAEEALAHEWEGVLQSHLDGDGGATKAIADEIASGRKSFGQVDAELDRLRKVREYKHKIASLEASLADVPSYEQIGAEISEIDGQIVGSIGELLERKRSLLEERDARRDLESRRRDDSRTLAAL